MKLNIKQLVVSRAAKWKRFYAILLHIYTVYCTFVNLILRVCFTSPEQQQSHPLSSYYQPPLRNTQFSQYGTIMLRIIIRHWHLTKIAFLNWVKAYSQALFYKIRIKCQFCVLRPNSQSLYWSVCLHFIGLIKGRAVECSCGIHQSCEVTVVSRRSFCVQENGVRLS